MGDTEDDALLSRKQRALLLTHARAAIEATLHNRSYDPSLSARGEPVLSAPRGAFVTLKIKKRLRGCIGSVEPVRALDATVFEMAVAAAFKDPRFDGVTLDELPELHIEISVLSLPSLIDNVAEIQVGRHGLLVEKGELRGLLLPQVADDYGWDATAFLQHTCDKAALPRDAWQDDDTNVYVFSAEVFGEE